MIQSGEVDRAKHHAPRQGGHGGGKQAGDLAKAQATAEGYDQDSRFVLPLPLNCPMRPAAAENIVSCRHIFIDLVSSATAFPAVPNMTGALIAPVLRPVGGYQLIAALNAFHPEAATTIRNSHPHVASMLFAFT